MLKIEKCYYSFLLSRLALSNTSITGVLSDEYFYEMERENNDGTSIIVSNTLTNGIIGAYQDIVGESVMVEHGIYQIPITPDIKKTILDYIDVTYKEGCSLKRMKGYLKFLRDESDSHGMFHISLTKFLDLEEILHFLPYIFQLQDRGSLATFSINFHYQHISSSEVDDPILTFSGVVELSEDDKNTINTHYDLMERVLRLFDTDELTIRRKENELFIESAHKMQSLGKFSLLKLKYPYAEIKADSHNGKIGSYTIKRKHKLKKL